MGSYKALDTLQNVILVCSRYNDLMESDAEIANQARELGHKLSKFASPTSPVSDNALRKWFYLDERGGKAQTDPPSYLI